MRLPLTPRALAASLILAAPFALAQDNQAPAEPAPAPQADTEKDPVAYAIKQLNEQDNGVTVNRDDLSLDIDATVVLRKGEFLEMFACTPDTREHESILVTDAMPSIIHLGLLLLGQEPGKPLSYDMNFDPPKLVPAKGPEIEVFIVVEVAGVEREIPANRWVQDNKTQEMMQGNTWLFAGSQFAEFDGKQIYHADLNGSAISLVNFGDDLLTLPNAMTDDNTSHNKVWAPRTKAIPKVGTEVAIRLRAQKPDIKDPDAQSPKAPPLPKPQPEPAPQPEQEAGAADPPDEPKG
ncbi:MAG: YdjY domain-containing protein [Phycisphaeraceae bacterium]